MDIKDLSGKIEEVVTSALKSGQGSEEIFERETEKVAKNFFRKNGAQANEVAKQVVQIVKDLKNKVGDDNKALTSIAAGILKGAIGSGRLSVETAKTISENVIKECMSAGIDLKEIPKLLFKNVHQSFLKKRFLAFLKNG